MVVLGKLMFSYRQQHSLERQCIAEVNQIRFEFDKLKRVSIEKKFNRTFLLNCEFKPRCFIGFGNIKATGSLPFQ